METHLAEGELTMLGAHPEASNLAIVCEVEHEGGTLTAIYKPVQGERPLWDYPDGHLAHRERAAYLVARLGGFDCVPATVLRAGPLGEGSVQRWVGTLDEPADSPVAVTRPGQIPPGYLRVLSGEDERGTGVVLSHPDDPVLRSLSVLDAVINNSDRKGSHVLLEGDGVYGIDNGVSLSVEPKLRTVLWGWAGDPLTDADRARVERLVEAIEGSPEAGELDELLTVTEVDALVARCERLLRAGRHPRPGHGWPSVPWPPV
ncbi:SCO1664 family protein [Janibacter melonis]|uniref:SCO1664 family protein n=1 Tax=Janibacter melonis TaxID=262209 RepID=UPI0027DFBC3E|nr:SCO1664 family protein [Janibacter melonis]MCB5990162.1 SCO1664 family protein [Janibacter melonis]